MTENINESISKDTKRHVVTNAIGEILLIELTDQQAAAMDWFGVEVARNGLYDESSGDYFLVGLNGTIFHLDNGWGSCSRDDGWVLVVKKEMPNPHHPNVSPNIEYAMLNGIWGAD